VDALEQVVIAGLRPDTVYQFEVEAYTRKGRGDRSRPRKVRTKGAGSIAQAQTLLLLSADVPLRNCSLKLYWLCLRQGAARLGNTPSLPANGSWTRAYRAAT